VRNLREKMMNNMCPNIVVDIVEPSIIPVNSRQAALHIIPFLVKKNIKFRRYLFPPLANLNTQVPN
jgi:hypothetical protein